MDKAEILAEINRLAQLLAEGKKPDAPAIRTVKVGDLEWQADVPDQTFTWAEAEVERLREAARQVHALAEMAVGEGWCFGVVGQTFRDIHEITKGMVE